MNEREQFFYDNAGWSYDSLTETPEEGHVNTAKHLANAERWAAENDIEFVWERDPEELIPAYVCLAGSYPELCGCMDVEAALAGVTFEEGQSWLTDPYAQVVEAELASEIAFQRGLVRS
jgi:hypothetical protein